MRPNWKTIFLDFAEVLSTRSTCKRLKTGCLIITPDYEKIIAFGYNGNAKNFPNTCDSDEEGKCGCLHSEINALVKYSSIRGSIMFSTHSPCIMCAKLIINSGITEVFYRNVYRIGATEILRKGNVYSYLILP